MKKIISAILCFSLLASIICVPVSATEDFVASESIEEFCEDVNEMVTEYSDSEFVTPDFIEEEQIPENTDEEIEINYCPRLIVQSDKPIDTYNAIEVVSGFLNFYILQFKNEEDTNYAYEQYKNDPNIISVEYDVSYDALLGTTEAEFVEDEELTYEDYKNGWYLQSTGMDMVLEEYKDQDLPEFLIAVVDTGVDLNCECLQDRIIRTGFNNSGDEDENSEQDTINGHGTMVSSVIANSTTDNVKIANYKWLNGEGKTESYAIACSAVLQAVNDGADAVNCSFRYHGEYALMEQIVEYAYSKECLIIAAAGNLVGDIGKVWSSPLNASDLSVSVAANNKYNFPTSFTAYGKPIDVMAPGEDMPLFTLRNEVVSVAGTSFSSPLMASVYAMFSTVNPKVSFEEKVRAIKGCGVGTDEKFATDYFGSGIVSVLGLFGLDTIPEPVFSVTEGKYIGEVSLELSCDDSNADIYFTTDCTYPSPDNGILYTEPFVFEDQELRIRAVAYKDGKRSEFVSEDICSVTLGTDDMFTINDNGVITGYSGNVKYLKIPETINGITVTDIAYSSGFTDAELYGVILPDTLEYLGRTFNLYERSIPVNEQVGPFNSNKYIEFIVGNNIKTVGALGVANISSIGYVDFPNCEDILYRGFRNAGFVGVDFPKVKTIGREAFDGAVYLREAYFPLCQKIGCNAFNENNGLTRVYLPNANYMEYKDIFSSDEILYSADSNEATKDMFLLNNSLEYLDLPNFETIGNEMFSNTAVKRVDLSEIKYIYDLPDTMPRFQEGTEFYYSYYDKYYCPVPVELSLPSTLQYCVPATDYKNEYINYIVYGTKGTYAESWATTNDVQFVELTPETAIVEDIEPIWDKYSYKPLEFDARGFNRTYQWYGSNDAKQGNYDDKAIRGATEKTFDPGDDAQYQYYYCKMTSTDKNIDGEVVSEVTVNSSMCHNRFHLMYAKEDTYIDFTNKYIYTLKQGCKDVLDIVGVPSTTDYRYLPSHGVLKEFYYGTSAVFVVYTNGTQQSRYTIVVQGDTNGDSVVDALDVADVEKTVNGNYELYDEFYLAADLDCDEGLSMTDYQQVVNRALTS